MTIDLKSKMPTNSKESVTCSRRIKSCTYPLADYNVGECIRIQVQIGDFHIFKPILSLYF